MSVYHKDKCTKEEISEFRESVKSFLDAEQLPYTTIKALRSYNGEVRIYNGKIAKRLRFRMGKKLVAFRNPNGSIEGENEEAINKLKQSNGDQLWQTTNEPIETIDYTQVFRADNWEEEKEAIKDFFKVNQ
ncbi:MAG: hypothetical protein ABIF11_11650 [Nitrospirota bacterium]